MSTTKPRVFIPSGAGAPGFGGILNCLTQNNFSEVIAGDSNEFAYGRGLVEHFCKMPPSSDENEYLTQIKSIILGMNVDLVLPITTRELTILSKHKVELEKLGTKVVVSELSSLNIANHKAEVLKWANQNGLPAPQGFSVVSWDDFNNKCRELLNQHKKVCFKPVLGNGSRGLGFVCDERELNFALEKPGEFWMTLNEWEKRLKPKFDEGLELLVAEYLPGVEYSVDCLVFNGKMMNCIPRSRDKMIGGISVAGTIENNEEIISQTTKLVLGLNLEGPIGVQWKADIDGKFKLLEVNPRLQGTTSAALLAGVNIPQKTVKHYLGLPDNETNEPIWGTRFSRFWKDVGISYYLRDHYE